MGHTTRGDEHRNHKDDPDGLEGDHDGQRQETEEEVVQETVRERQHARLAGIETDEQEVFSENEGHTQYERAEHECLYHLRAYDP